MNPREPSNNQSCGHVLVVPSMKNKTFPVLVPDHCSDHQAPAALCADTQWPAQEGLEELGKVVGRFGESLTPKGMESWRFFSTLVDG